MNTESPQDKWEKDLQECRAAYPEFDLDAEMDDVATGELFIALMEGGASPKTAYEIIHYIELFDIPPELIP